MVSHRPNIFATYVSVNLTDWIVAYSAINANMFRIFYCFYLLVVCSLLEYWNNTLYSTQGTSSFGSAIFLFHFVNIIQFASTILSVIMILQRIMKWYTRYRRQFDWLITTINFLTSLGFLIWVHGQTSCAQLNKIHSWNGGLSHMTTIFNFP
jgi:hypothetical protein